MSPPISKDWWLAAALTSAALPAALGQPAAGENRPQSAVVTSAIAGSRTANNTSIYIDGTSDHRLITDAKTTMHVLFSDQSAITLGPNSELVITKYQFDSRAKTGQLLINMSKGLLRVVGGFLSKKSETVVRTNTATVGIRGGISLIESDDTQTNATFLFGQQMRVSSLDDTQNQTVTRPGFGVTTSSNGPSSPFRRPIGEISSQLRQLDLTNESEQGSTPPTAQLPSDDVNAYAPDRVNAVGDDPDMGFQAPTLRDVLGSQSPGNQS